LVHEQFDVVSLLRGNALAVAGPGGQTLSYNDLRIRSNRVAHHLQSLGVGPGVVVGILLPPSADFIVASLAILKAGAAYLPIDISYPMERQAFLLEDSQAPVVVTDSCQNVPSKNTRVVRVDADSSAIAEQSEGDISSLAVGDDLAYVIYTSGSTGRPKGVEITHSSLLNLVSWHLRTFNLTPEDRTSQVAGLAFDAAVWEIWPTMVSGASLHIADGESRTGPERMHEWLLRERITVCFAPTAIAEQLIVIDWPGGTNLRFLLTGADRLVRFPNPGLPFKLVNNYGPTEFTVVATSGIIEPVAIRTELPSIGRPIDNTRIYVLDNELKPVKKGVSGELFLSGASLAKGYRDRPELTAERFLPNPFSGIKGDRMYRTGDLVRLLEDGRVAFLGRVDDQIKIRGFRIEPAEISSMLDQHPSISASIVAAREDKAGNLRLVGYVVLKEQVSSLDSVLREYLRRQLPEWMIPSVFFALEQLPLTANGKLDRAALPHPDDRRADSNVHAKDLPRTPLEESVSAIVTRILGFDQIGIHENFFTLGGHSLMGAQVIARIRDTFAVQLTLRDLFIAPNVALLAARTEELLTERLSSMSEEEIDQYFVATSDGNQAA
jgi:amino acid adenylation domain-containing protein